MRQIIQNLRSYFQELSQFFRKGDMILLTLCLVLSAFGCLVIASATNVYNTPRYVIIQIVAIIIGLCAYAATSSLDAEFLSEHRTWLIGFNILLLAMLVPFGVVHGGNRSWLSFPFLPIEIQPAEIIKMTYILITASVMASHQNRPSALTSVIHVAFHMVLVVGLNMVLSSDAGVSLIFVFIFIGMAFAGGIGIFWFLFGSGLLVAALPILWNVIMSNEQRDRILALIDPSIDPQGLDELWQFTMSKRSLTGGGFFGQGLFEGTRTQTEGALFAQHTDFIFAAIGEELGFFGCAFVLIMLLLIIARCIQVGISSPDYMRRLICFGAASGLLFQVLVNVGMCLGVMPVIGLTLPFVSYGGSSIVSLYAMLGLVSGVHARPTPTSHERYVRPPIHL